MKCMKCKAIWEYGPSDVCPICRGTVKETSEESKRAAPPPLSQTKAWWEKGAR
jgi:hypothetical protein